MSEEHQPAARRGGMWPWLLLAAALAWFGNECKHQSWDAARAAAAMHADLANGLRLVAAEISRLYPAASPSLARVLACVGDADGGGSADLPPLAAEEVRKGDEAMAAARALMAEAEKALPPLGRSQHLTAAERKLEAARQHFARAVALAPSDKELLSKSREATRLFYLCREQRANLSACR